MQNSLKKGFTLIELLVVVAVIGILASVVLASLTSARSKGKDAAIFSQLSSIRTQAELLYANMGSYGLTSGAGTNYTCMTGDGGTLFNTYESVNPGAARGILEGIAKTLNNGSTLSTSEAVCNFLPTGSGGAKVTSWAIAVKGASSNQYYCADSNGTAKGYAVAAITSALAAGATTCN